MRRIRIGAWGVLLGALALAAGCAPRGGGDDAAERAAREALRARVEALEGRLASLERAVEDAGNPKEQIEALERRLGEISKSETEMYNDCIDQILRLRDHVTLQFGRLRKDAEGKRLQGLAREDRSKLDEILSKGGVRLDAESRTIRVHGSICLTEGFLEFLAVGQGGKDHESLLYLDCVPSVLNAAFLALGLEAGHPFHVEEKRPDSPPGGVPYGPDKEKLLYYPPSGPPVYVYVEWGEGDARVRKRAEDLILVRATGKSMARSGWVYVGSRFAPDGSNGGEIYVADITQDMISTWHSYKGNTILDTPIPEAMDDDRYVPNKKALPPRGTPVEVLFTLDPLDQ